MPLFTIGHSNHSSAAFLGLLRHHSITTLLDLRSRPYSRHNPHFNREQLEGEVAGAGMTYSWVGSHLGGMGEGGFEAALGREETRQAIDELVSRIEKEHLAVMCAEAKWENCHRRILARELTSRGVRVQHIGPDGSIEIHPRSLDLF